MVKVSGASGVGADKLERRQEAFLLAMLKAPSVASAARECGIAVRTARRWMALPAMQKQYRELRREAVDQALTVMQTAASLAAATLVKQLRAESGALQIRAAQTILEHAVKAVELVDVLERLEALEAQQAARQQQQPGHQRPTALRGSGA